MNEVNNPKVVFLATYPPRKCGIGTFTKDLAESVDRKSNPLNSQILAIDESYDCNYEYDEKVINNLSVNDYVAYKELAREINDDDSVKVVCIQHEFGIFGGEGSCHPLPFLDELKKPVIITFHSVFPKPIEEVYHQVRAIAKRVNRIIVMTETGEKLLREDYGITSNISIIPHGIPDVEFESQEKFKEKHGIGNRFVLSSFGMVGPGKGYENVIEAMPEIVKRYPDVLYLIVGATHPGVIEEEGEAYRDSLKDRIRELCIEKNVGFVDRYLTLDELLEFLKASDLYMSTSMNPEQITSGTLVYAMGCGRAIVSTPFPHAKDLIKKNNGSLVGFKDKIGIEKVVIDLLSNDSWLKEIEVKNYEVTRKMTWDNIGLAYDKVMKEVIGEDISQSDM